MIVDLLMEAESLVPLTALEKVHGSRKTHVLHALLFQPGIINENIFKIRKILK